MSISTVATAASTVSALIFPSGVRAFPSSENSASPHVCEHRSEKEQGAAEVEQVYHEPLIDASDTGDFASNV